ncbi:hypothetical protein [Curtobacterium sp. ISL-83]|uniref:hypothetical protein n=1 Tax=Curtobacterium sp. ISL-83 TaxID=2819145 RepID=UPI001BEC6F90|nr:hypothetical protein [Curtobacterium sp. ISL-83]MBT2502708.1 hypothetical protein [Curtobacterium sp. ISL-83]
MDVRRRTRRIGRPATRTTLTWVAVVIVALVVVDVVLVALALGRTGAEHSRPAGPIPTYSSAPVPSRTPGSKPTSTPAANPGATPTANAGAQTATSGASGRRLLSAVDATEAWRASSGRCGGDAPVLERSTDAGATWKAVHLGSDVRSLIAIRASSSSLSIVAGIGDGCETTTRTSTDDAASWTAGAAGAAGAGLADGGVVLSTGTVPAPCADPVQAFQGQHTSVVVCGDALDWRSGTDAWVRVPITGVRSLGVDGNAYTIARVGAVGCDGVDIATMPATGVTASSTVTSIGCWSAAATDGPVTINRAGQAVWAWAGDVVHVSGDGGKSW